MPYSRLLIPGVVTGSACAGTGTRRRPSSTLLGAALFANGLDFERAGEKLEFTEMRHALDECVDLGHLDILNAPAVHTKYMMMGFDMAIITRATMKRCYLARLAYLAKLFENPMYRGQ